MKQTIIDISYREKDSRAIERLDFCSMILRFIRMASMLPEEKTLGLEVTNKGESDRQIRVIFDEDVLLNMEDCRWIFTKTAECTLLEDLPEESGKNAKVIYCLMGDRRKRPLYLEETEAQADLLVKVLDNTYGTLRLTSTACGELTVPRSAFGISVNTLCRMCRRATVASVAILPKRRSCNMPCACTAVTPSRKTRHSSSRKRISRCPTRLNSRQQKPPLAS